MHTFTILNQDGEEVEGQEGHGMTYFSEIRRVLGGRTLHEQHELALDMPIRPDDVYLVTYTKSGTHWIWEIVSMLQKGKAEYQVKAKESAMIDFYNLSDIDAEPSPRALNTHMPPHLIPRGILEQKNKIIHLLRNPKDVAVSMYCMFATMYPKDRSKMSAEQKLYDSFSTSMKVFLGDFDGKCFGYPWPAFVKEWDTFTNQNPEQVLTLYFEDLKEDPCREIRKICAFLDISADDKLVADVADACSFKKLRAANAEIKDDPLKKMFPDVESVMYRKGEVGDWKNWFTVAENERFDNWLKENVPEEILARFRYSLD